MIEWVEVGTDTVVSFTLENKRGDGYVGRFLGKIVIPRKPVLEKGKYVVHLVDMGRYYFGIFPTRVETDVMSTLLYIDLVGKFRGEKFRIIKIKIAMRDPNKVSAQEILDEIVKYVNRGTYVETKLADQIRELVDEKLIENLLKIAREKFEKEQREIEKMKENEKKLEEIIGILNSKVKQTIEKFKELGFIETRERFVECTIRVKPVAGMFDYDIDERPSDVIARGMIASLEPEGVIIGYMPLERLLGTDEIHGKKIDVKMIDVHLKGCRLGRIAVIDGLEFVLYNADSAHSCWEQWYDEKTIDEAIESVIIYSWLQEYIRSIIVEKVNKRLGLELDADIDFGSEGGVFGDVTDVNIDEFERVVDEIDVTVDEVVALRKRMTEVIE